MTEIAKVFNYEEIKSKKRFRIEPSHRRSNKPMDPEQFKIFLERQKRITELWRGMGVVSWRVIHLDKDASRAAEPGIDQ